jgi:hypothetical protein
MKIPYETRTIVDYSFKLGYLFSVTISDLREILTFIKEKNYEKTLNLIETDFLIRFNFIEKYFYKLFTHEAINESEFNDIKNFCKGAQLTINDVINEIKNTNSMTKEKIELVEKLLNDLLDN